jgi:hypothetical protein
MVQTAPEHGIVDANPQPSKTWLDIVGVVSCFLFIFLASATAAAIGVLFARMLWAVYYAALYGH